MDFGPRAVHHLTDFGQASPAHAGGVAHRRPTSELPLARRTQHVHTLQFAIRPRCGFSAEDAQENRVPLCCNGKLGIRPPRRDLNYSACPAWFTGSSSVTKRASPPRSPGGNPSRHRKAPNRLHQASSSPDNPPRTRRRGRMQEIDKTLTDMNELHMIPNQSNQMQGGWSSKLQEHITSEGPPAHITRSTKSPGPKRSSKEKMIGEFRELSIKALTGMAYEAEITPEDEAGAKRDIEALTRRFPDMFKSPKPH